MGFHASYIVQCVAAEWSVENQNIALQFWAKEAEKKRKKKEKTEKSKGKDMKNKDSKVADMIQ